MTVRNKFVSSMLAILFIFASFAVDSEAANVVEVPASEIDGVLYQDVESNQIENWPEGPHIYSESGIVMDMDTGAILYAKNIDDQHYPASITKVATALIALQNYKMDEIVTFTWDDISFLEYGDAHIGIKENEQLLMEDAMYGMMLASANEVSHAIGAHMEGGFDKFLEVMNETTTALGCTNSNWMNTNGLHDAEHYTSVHDMALIGSEVFKYDIFREIVNTYEHVIPETNITDEKRYVHQNHKMIREWDNRYYEYCVGGKTGYTDQALTTLVTFATKGDMNLIAVVMRTHGGGNNAYADTRKMLDYAFDNFTKVPVTKNMFMSENVAYLDTEGCVTLPNGVTTNQLEAVKVDPTAQGDFVAKIQFSYQGCCVGTVKAAITQEYYNEIHGIKPENEMKEADKRGDFSAEFKVLKIVLIAVAVLVLCITGFLGYLGYKRRQIRKRHRMRRKQNYR